MIGREPILQLVLNERSAEISVLDAVKRKKDSRVGLILFSGFLDGPISELDSSDDESSIF